MRSLYKESSMVMPLTQGAIINHCVADDYSGQDVLGMIITPRCDLAHEGKVNSVHYLPIVNFEEWLKVDGEEYFYNKWIDKNARKFKKACLDYGMPADLNRIELYNAMANEMIDDENKRKAFLDLCTQAINKDKDGQGFKAYKQNKDTLDSLMDNLLSDNLPAYYLLEDWNAQEKKLRVILLREPKRISLKTIRKVNNVLKEEQIDKTKDDVTASQNDDDFFQVCCQIASPYVEHIMQHFSHNFCRVGVEDRNFEVGRELLQQTLKHAL